MVEWGMTIRQLANSFLTYAFSGLIMGLGLCAPAHAMIEVSGVRLGIHEDKTRLVIDLSHEARFKVLETDTPTRFQLKLFNTQLPQQYTTTQKGKGYIAGYYFTQAPQNSIILNVESKSAAKLAKAFPLTKASDGPYRLVVDIKPDKSKTSKKQKDVPKGKRAERTSEDTVALPIKNEVKAKSETVSESKTSNIPLPFIKPLRRVVVIDPGHGGHDPGTISPKGIHEKDITLAVALEMKRIIDKSGKYTAVLTRTKDQHLPLRYRFSVAREMNANLLISLHTDSNANKNVRGVSVYTLSETATDEEAKRLAHKENSADFLEDLKFAQTEEKDVKDILINLSQTRAKNNSVVFADTLMKKFHKQEALLKNTHRSADFAVLKAPDVASVLIELGYLSNASDQKRLVSKPYQRKIASLIVTAIDDYFEHIKS
jgi:N-acetylmuramoyl-L-alanine amidase